SRVIPWRSRAARIRVASPAARGEGLTSSGAEVAGQQDCPFIMREQCELGRTGGRAGHGRELVRSGAVAEPEGVGADASLENLPLMPGGSDAHTGELAEHVRDDGACGSLPAFNRSQGFNMLEFDGDLNTPTPCRCAGEAGAGRPCWS